MTMTGNDRFSKILSHKPSLHFLPILSKCSNWFPKYRCKVLSVRHLRTPPKKSVAKKFVFNSKLLYLCTSNRKKASLVPKVGRYRRHIWVSIDARCRTSMTTQTRARNGASGELKYQPSKHTKVWLIIALPCVLRTVTSLKSIRLNHVSTRQWVQEPPCRCHVQSRSQPQRTGCSHQGHQSWQSQRESQHSNYSWRRF